MKTYYVYILASKSGVLYVGVTNDLDFRVAQHKAKRVPGFTAKYNCDRLVWYEPFANVNEAIDTEKRIKGWRREKKVKLIAEMNPAWADLTVVQGPTQLDTEVPRVATAPLGMTGHSDLQEGHVPPTVIPRRLADEGPRSRIVF
jgi:putative endonuclease